MAQLTDDQVDDVLREAEERLASRGSEITPTVVKKLQSGTQPQPQPAGTKEKLSVRQLQKSTAPPKESAGPDWFNLPKTDLTSEFKRDWQILRMRNVLDPKHQKKTLRANPPAFSQVGEIIAGPTDFYSSRLARKERKRTLLQEAMSSRDDKIHTKSAEIRRKKASGGKGAYQRLLSQRRKQKG